MIETDPACCSAAAFGGPLPTRGVGRQPVTSPTIALASPRASDCTSAVIADCSALLALNTRASSALITRNSATPGDNATM